MNSNKRRIVALSGYGKAGKSTIAEHFAGLGWHRMSFAIPIKARCNPILQRMGIDPATPEGKAQSRPAYVCVGELGRAEDPERWVKILEDIMPKEGDIIIDDLRYANEAGWARRLGGLLLYINRPGIGPANGVEYESVSQMRSAFKPHVIENDEPDRISHTIRQVWTAIDWHYKRN